MPGKLIEVGKSEYGAGFLQVKRELSFWLHDFIRYAFPGLQINAKAYTGLDSIRRITAAMMS